MNFSFTIFHLPFSKVLIFIFSLLFTFHLLLITIKAEPNCTSPGPGDFDYCIQKIQQEIDLLRPAQEYNKSELADLKQKIKSIETKIESIVFQLEEVEKDILKREEDVYYTETIFEEKTSNHYKFLRLYDPLMPFLAEDSASKVFREVNFRHKAANDDLKTIEGLAQELIDLKNDKDNLEKSQQGLAVVRQNLKSRAVFLEEEVEKTESYLASLSARQEELIALKEAGFQTSIGDTPPTLEPCSGPPGSSNYCDPGFRPAYGAFSFGAPHRTGLSQYGAYGRSKQGQSAETILSVYYQGSELNKSYPIPATINVTGYGAIPFEDNYLLGIYEVPESWGDNGGFEALKAQAVSARSYALAVTQGGGSICASESCQVYKPQLKTGKWAEAVRVTRGWVLIKDGQPAKAYYASTSGGYTINNWNWSGIKDTQGDWPDTAYEKIAQSPWFYKAWYKTRSGATCGKANPWLTSQELADILNSWQVLYTGGGDTSRISPIDTSCWGGNPYSISELSAIGGYNSVSSVSIIYANDGSTKTIYFDTNKGSISIDGGEFKRAFNLRAPGYIGIKSSLFNIEKL
ncbi:hypothetical protein A2Z22_02800 [Candidatus Woesebacteria bacterium RBG_16_34_12]|uniref:Sporulation stage II protein D amidase enhancer LytB N-terminal domain-containing protein n=1 Tax=Candidatus Woesebacteria bacterium RBG_16_34_12 TaxID=1802480 RepID=A0A1F7X6T2_9BACT|nr:MAG: hypothetical protein A2Z22_02800 [Candidatus Woesebacteria bacterium RBG_16_34_12]